MGNCNQREIQVILFFKFWTVVVKKNACQLTKKFDMAKHILLLWWNQFSMSYPCVSFEFWFSTKSSRTPSHHRNCNFSGKICTYIIIFARHHMGLKSRKKCPFKWSQKGFRTHFIYCTNFQILVHYVETWYLIRRNT